jgi:hypothetical protein
MPTWPLLKQHDPPDLWTVPVQSVALLSETPKDNRLPVRLDFDVQSVGKWQCDIAVHMPTNRMASDGGTGHANLQVRLTRICAPKRTRMAHIPRTLFSDFIPNPYGEPEIKPGQIQSRMTGDRNA